MLDNRAEGKGRVVVVSGPSGVGKGTLLKRLFATSRFPLETSVSCTTRAPRVGERDGVDYWFLSRDEFLRRRARGEFLESFEVFSGGALYGTLKETVERATAKGAWVVLEIDVKGAKSVLEQIPDAITIFIAPPSLDALRARLVQRGTEPLEEIERRLARAKEELQESDFYKHQIVNDDLDVAFAELVAALESEV